MKKTLITIIGVYMTLLPIFPMPIAQASTYEGSWSGNTDQGYDVSFTVSDNNITEFGIKLEVQGVHCSVTISGSQKWTPGKPISGNTFSIKSPSSEPNKYEYKGTFTSETSCSGSWYYYSEHCDGSGTGTWTANLAQNARRKAMPWLQLLLLSEEQQADWGNYLVVDGVDDYADFTTEGPLDVAYTGTKDFTVDAWIYPTDYGAFVSDDAYDLGYVNRPEAGGNVIMLTVWGDAQKRVECYYLKNLFNGWHHIVGMFDNSRNKAAIGIDGHIKWYDFDDDDGLWNGDFPLHIGTFNSASGYFEGKIDEVRVSNILRYFGSTYSTPTAPFKTDQNTLGLWHFDDPAGSTSFVDSSGNGNTLSAHNGATTEGPVSK